MKIVKVAAGVIQRDGQYFVCRRQAQQHQGNKWEFPGGKIERDEEPIDALKRELKEEIDIFVNHAEILTEIHHDYPDKSVYLYFFLVRQFEGEAKGAEGQEVAWYPLESLKRLEFPDANKAVLDLLD